MDKELLPVVHKIITDAERQLARMIGLPVTLRMEMAYGNVSTDEAQHIMLQRMVCDEFGIPWNKVIERSRKRQEVDARSAYCYLAKKLLGYSLKRIAGIIGKDHTTVIHNIRRADGFIHVCDDGSKKILRIQKRFYEDYIKAEA